MALMYQFLVCHSWLFYTGGLLGQLCDCPAQLLAAPCPPGLGTLLPGCPPAAMAPSCWGALQVSGEPGRSPLLLWARVLRWVPAFPGPLMKFSADFFSLLDPDRTFRVY